MECRPYRRHRRPKRLWERLPSAGVRASSSVNTTVLKSVRLAPDSSSPPMSAAQWAATQVGRDYVMMPFTPAQIDELRRVLGASELRRQAAEVKLADRERRLGTARQTIATQDRRIGWLTAEVARLRDAAASPCPMTTLATPGGSSPCTASAVPADARLPPQNRDQPGTHIAGAESLSSLAPATYAAPYRQRRLRRLSSAGLSWASGADRRQLAAVEPLRPDCVVALARASTATSAAISSGVGLPLVIWIMAGLTGACCRVCGAARTLVSSAAFRGNG